MLAAGAFASSSSLGASSSSDPSFLPDLQKKLELPSHDVRPTIDKIEPDPKRFKAMLKDEKEKVTILLETFVETFMSAFIKTLGIYHLLAKDKLLTEEA